MWCRLVLASLLLTACAAPQSTPPRAPTHADRRAEIEAFNRALDDATRRIDSAATVALWEDDGVSLLPNTDPIVGKNAIGALIGDLVAKHPKIRMKSFELACEDVEVADDIAHEVCFAHQVVELDPGEAPFDGWGKMLLVLHRGADGHWRLRREMWNEAKGPRAKR